MFPVRNEQEHLLCGLHLPPEVLRPHPPPVVLQKLVIGMSSSHAPPAGGVIRDAPIRPRRVGNMLPAELLHLLLHWFRFLFDLLLDVISNADEDRISLYSDAFL